MRTVDASRRLGGRSKRWRLGILLTSAVSVLLLAVPVSATSARLVWNTSASAPAGIYWIEKGQWQVGDRVAAQPSAILASDLDRRGILPRGRLLIKRVVAGQGMTVCRYHSKVLVDGEEVAVAKATTSLGELLPVWQGCTTLSAEDVFLLGDAANSYDGRYFGVTSRQDIVGRVSLLVAIGD